jgi:DTW domain-containing protein YfiP
VCALLPRVDNQTEVLVLQHPRERLHPIGTARFAQLGLARGEVRVAWNAGEAEFTQPAWLPEGTGLLYPTADARELSSVPRAERPRTLLVLDGTWHTAKTLYRDKHWLHALPHYRLEPEQPSRYRLRREPHRDYVSTIEAIVGALTILEPETRGFTELLGAFDAMIDAQAAFVGRGAIDGNGRTRKRRRPRQQLRVPRALVEGFERMVIVYGEASRRSAEFAYFVAQALHSGDTFSCLIRPRGGLPELTHLGHMGLTPEHFEGACTNAEFCARWQDFLGRLADRQVLPLTAAWNQRTLDMLAVATDTPPSQVSLKAAYRAVHGIHAFSLEDVVQQRGLTLGSPGFLGRASPRLASAVAVAEFLHARATGAAQG